MHTIIIAEAGVNHNGKVKLAKVLIEKAADAGADYIKFQAFKANLLVSANAPCAEYQRKYSGNYANNQYQLLKDLELGYDSLIKLKEYATRLNIGFLASAFDFDSINFLHRLKLDYWKIPSGEITNLPYLEKIGQLKGKIILSSGMATMQEVDSAINVLSEQGLQRENIVVLHCNTEYPTPVEDVNLLAMVTMRKTLGIKTGYSDHTEDIEIPIAATALGAVIIEKHFTLDKKMTGPDHNSSLEPGEFKEMVQAIRKIDIALGSGEKIPSISEKKNIETVRKSIHSISDLPQGTVITINHLIMKRPGNGISPMELNKVIGKRLANNISADHKLIWTDLENE